MSGRLDLCWLPLLGALTCLESWRKRLELANGITLKHSFLICHVLIETLPELVEDAVFVNWKDF